MSVTLSSSDGSASAGQDYTALNTTVSFAAGDTAAKAVTVSVSDDGAGEADETLSLTLSAPTGGASLGAVATATLTIRDNDGPAAAVLQVDADIKQLVFTWASVPGATHYRLFQNPDGASGFTQVGADYPANATTAALGIAVHLHNWPNAQYRLEACNMHSCSVSAAVDALDAMVRAIGYFKASNTEALDFFGIALALSRDGSTLAIGAESEDSNATVIDGHQGNNDADNSGAVYVYARDGATWTQQAYIKASNSQEVDKFGAAVALSADGSVLAVGAYGEDGGGTGVGGDPTNNDYAAAGAVYVFTRAGSQWAEQAYIKASNTDPEDSFGSAVALSGDGNTLAVSAIEEDGNGVDGEGNDDAADSGAVYVFARNNTQWSQRTYLKASNTEAGDTFGGLVALSGDGTTLATTAPQEDSNATGINGDQANNDAQTAGAAYLF